MPTPEDVVNQALEIAGTNNRISSFYDGTREATLALDLWSTTRDQLLEAEAPDWSIANATLVLLKSAQNIVNYSANYDPPVWDATLYPQSPWLYEYQYPEDCIDPVQVKWQPSITPIWKPRPNTFRLNSSGLSRTILTNVPDAILVYVRRITDPNDWHDAFIFKMKVALAKQFEPTISPQRARQEQADANAAR